MKKLHIVLFSIVILAMLLTSCKSTPPEAVPMSNLDFEVEPNPDYIGSYTIERVNVYSSWTEWGEWTPFEALIGREIVCFGYYQGGNGTFRARSDYHWVEVEFDGRMCLELQKK